MALMPAESGVVVDAATRKPVVGALVAVAFLIRSPVPSSSALRHSATSTGDRVCAAARSTRSPPARSA